MRKSQKKLTILIAIIIINTLLMSTTVSGITNGVPDEEKHPYVCIVGVDYYEGESYWRGSGVLISPTVVVTAAHLVAGSDMVARVWFDEDVTGDLDFPEAGATSHEGTVYIHPEYDSYFAPGLEGFSTHDVAVIVLDEPVDMDEYGALPAEDLVDTLPMMTDVQIVGYGRQWQEKGGGTFPYDRWRGGRTRHYALSKLIQSNQINSDEFIKCTANPAKGKGGSTFGDSGGPVLLGDTNIVLAVNSFSNNWQSAGMTYHCRIDLAENLAFIELYLLP